MSFFSLRFKQLKQLFFPNNTLYNPFAENEKTMRNKLKQADERYLVFKCLRQITATFFPEVLGKMESEQMATDFILAFFTIYGVNPSEIYALEVKFQEEREKDIKSQELKSHL